jgi:hypothetical protein
MISRRKCPRRKFDILLALCCCVVLCPLIDGCSFFPGGASGPPAALLVVQTQDLGTIGTNPKISGRDEGYSGVFAGNSVWLYGDTFLANPNAEGQTLISDSCAFTTDFNAADGITGFREREDSVSAHDDSNFDRRGTSLQ